MGRKCIQIPIELERQGLMPTMAADAAQTTQIDQTYKTKEAPLQEKIDSIMQYHLPLYHWITAVSS